LITRAAGLKEGAGGLRRNARAFFLGRPKPPAAKAFVRQGSFGPLYLLFPPTDTARLK
jgi:hypothetical protein